MGPLRRPLLAALAVAAAVAPLAGCGGSNRLSEAQYRKQATTICRSVVAQERKLGSPTSPSDIKRYVQQLVRVAQPGVDRLRALKPPENRQQAFSAAVDAEQRTIDRLRQVAGSLKGTSADVATLRNVASDVQRLGRSADAAFRKAGVPGCAG